MWPQRCKSVQEHCILRLSLKCVGRCPECAPSEWRRNICQGSSEPTAGSVQISEKKWVCANNTGEVLTACCRCMAGQAKVCSHIGAVLWKVDLAIARGITAIRCTDSTTLWNQGTKRNVEPSRLSNIKFKLSKRSVDAPYQANQPWPLRTIMDAVQLQALHEASP